MLERALHVDGRPLPVRTAANLALERFVVGICTGPPDRSSEHACYSQPDVNGQLNPPGDPGRERNPLDDLIERARIKAAGWRASSFGEGLDAAVHPPARSALLATHLTAYLGKPIELPAAPKSLKRRLIHRLLGAERARVDRLFDYALLLTEDLSKTICRIEVELAELSARVGMIEDQVARPGTRSSERAG